MSVPTVTIGTTSVQWGDRAGDCSIDDCRKPARKRGWCEGHYYHFKTRGTPYGPQRVRQHLECAIDGCDATPLAKNSCERHYRAARRPLEKKRPRKAAQRKIPERTVCAVDQCERFSTARGWCGRHYQRWRRFKNPTFHPPAPERECQVPECDSISNARRLCSKHYRRWALYGDPLITRHRSQVALPGERRCSIADCVRRARYTYLCTMHYSRLKRNGDPEVRSTRSTMRDCSTCGSPFSIGNRPGRKYCGKTCKPSGRIAGSVNKRQWVEILWPE